DQPSVQCPDVYLAVPRRDAARGRPAARQACPFRRDIGIIGPQFLAGLAVVGGDDVVDADVIEHAVDDQRARLHAPHRLEIVVPGEAEALDGLVVYLIEGAETLLAPAAAIAHPVADVGGRVEVAHRLPV